MPPNAASPAVTPGARSANAVPDRAIGVLAVSCSTLTLRPVVVASNSDTARRVPTTTMSPTVVAFSRPMVKVKDDVPPTETSTLSERIIARGRDGDRIIALRQRDRAKSARGVRGKRAAEALIRRCHRDGRARDSGARGIPNIGRDGACVAEACARAFVGATKTVAAGTMAAANIATPPIIVPVSRRSRIVWVFKSSPPKRNSRRRLTSCSICRAPMRADRRRP